MRSGRSVCPESMCMWGVDGQCSGRAACVYSCCRGAALMGGLALGRSGQRSTPASPSPADHHFPIRNARAHETGVSHAGNAIKAGPGGVSAGGPRGQCMGSRDSMSPLALRPRVPHRTGGQQTPHGTPSPGDNVITPLGRMVCGSDAPSPTQVRRMECIPCAVQSTPNIPLTSVQ